MQKFALLAFSAVFGLLTGSLCADNAFPGWKAFTAGADEKAFEFDFSKLPGSEKRIAHDLAFKADITALKAFAYDIRVDGEPGVLDGVNHLVIFFRSGRGWYSWHANPPEEEGVWTKGEIEVSKLVPEGSPAGPDRIDGFRIYVDRIGGFSKRIRVTLRDLRAIAAVKNDSYERDTPEALAALRAVPPKPGERRLVWCHSPQGMDHASGWEASVAFMATNGFTDLIANLGWAGVAYYDSKFAPVSRSVAERGDSLELCLKACRAHGVKLHVWRVCYRLKDNEPELRAFCGRMLSEGRVYTAEGRWGREYWLCPSDPRTIQLEVDAMVELAGKGVDGIHFDYIRHRDGRNCCCERCRARFEAETGHRFVKWPEDAKKGEWAEKWEAFRERSIDEVVRRVAEIVRVKYPKCEISAAVQAHYRAVAQNWPMWCREGWLDFACPMDYAYSKRVFARQIAEQAEFVKGTKARLYPGIGISSSHGWPRDGEDARRFAEHVLAVREAGYDGFTSFNFDRRLTRLMPVMHESMTRE